MKNFKKFILISFVLFFIFIVGIIVFNNKQARNLDKEFNEKVLNTNDKKSVFEAHKLREKLGDQIWPQFGIHNIPIIIFNDKYEFIYAKNSLNDSWKRVENDRIKQNHYYYRRAQNPQAFTTNINGDWVSIMTGLDILNREIFLGLRRDLPQPFSNLIPYQLIKFDNDYHITAIIHEAFHAYQAEVAPKKFELSENIYGQEKFYPYNDEKFVTAWNEEGAILNRALETEDREEKINLIRKFIKHRKKRRKASKLSSFLINYEKRLEWLEGLAKYVEIEFYSLAAENEQISTVNFKDNPSYWKEDFKRLKGELGEKDGHNRFYISGMAQAKLLAQLQSDKWQSSVMKKNVYLEDLLKDEIGGM